MHKHSHTGCQINVIDKISIVGIILHHKSTEINIKRISNQKNQKYVDLNIKNG